MSAECADRVLRHYFGGPSPPMPPTGRASFEPALSLSLSLASFAWLLRNLRQGPPLFSAGLGLWWGGLLWGWRWGLLLSAWLCLALRDLCGLRRVPPLLGGASSPRGGLATFVGGAASPLGGALIPRDACVSHLPALLCSWLLRNLCGVAGASCGRRRWVRAAPVGEYRVPPRRPRHTHGPACYRPVAYRRHIENHIRAGNTTLP